MPDANPSPSVVLPLTDPGSSLKMGELDELFPGVKGYAMEQDGITYVPWLQAEHQGSGDVGRFLDALPSGIRIPNIINPRLEGMVRRRGWKLTYEFTPDGERVDVWLKI